MKIFITGIAGFIGYHTALKYKSMGYEVEGVDNFNSYYDTGLKHTRANLLREKEIAVHDLDIHLQPVGLQVVMGVVEPDLVIHLAAYAGVRHSMDNPMDYINTNIVGSQNVIDACEVLSIPDVIYASTSCVMHGNPLPWNESEKLNPALSPYGYTKACNEQQFAISKIPNAVGLRFFTVYGPYGRPDMALFDFTRAILNGETITIFNNGDMKRDFTYIDDVVSAIYTVSDNMTPRDLYCVGNGKQSDLMDFVREIETNCGVGIANIAFAPKHPADAKKTWSDTSKLKKLGWKPTVDMAEGVKKFHEWYVNFYTEGKSK